MNFLSHRVIRLSFLILTIVALGVILPFFITDYHMAILNLILIYYIACIGLNIVSGDTGQVSLAHAGFMCIGAYSSSVLTDKLGISFWAALPLAGALSFLVGFSLGFPALRLGGLSLAIATFGFTLVVQLIAMQWTSMTGGVFGLFTSKPTLWGMEFDTDERYFYLVFAVAVILTLAAKNLLRGKTGRAFHALRDSEVAAQLMGINLSNYKTIAFGLSGFYAGIAGGLYAHFSGRISPEIFGIGLAINFLAMIIIGGMASVVGSFIGATFYTILPEALRVTMEIQAIIFGLAVMFSLVYMPNGLAGAFQAFAQRAGIIIRTLPLRKRPLEEENGRKNK